MLESDVLWKSMKNDEVRKKSQLKSCARSKVISFCLFSYDVIEKCHTSWIINEDIVNLKNKHDFWVSRARNVASTKFYQSSSIISKVTRPSFKVKSTTGKTGTRVTSRLSQFQQRYFNFKWRPRNFWNNWARLIKIGICNISGMRNSKLMFIFKIDNVFIYYSPGDISQWCHN